MASFATAVPLNHNKTASNPNSAASANRNHFTGDHPQAKRPRARARPATHTGLNQLSHTVIDWPWNDDHGISIIDHNDLIV